MDSYLRLVMKLSDSLYYGVIKNADLSDGSINGEITSSFMITIKIM